MNMNNKKSETTSTPYKLLWVDEEEESEAPNGDNIMMIQRSNKLIVDNTNSNTMKFLRARALHNAYKGDFIEPYLVQNPNPKSYIQLVAKSLGIAQQVCLLCLIHLVLFRTLSSASGEEDEHYYFQNKLEIIHLQYCVCFGFILILIAVYSQRRSAIATRAGDLLLLILFLRLLAAMLRSLTASYSMDTVERLVNVGMGLNILSCDYEYANGHHRQSAKRMTTYIQHNRPIFLGGTFSLNAALFSVVLQASRLQSNVATFVYVSSSIVFFALYPEHRHNLAANSSSKNNISYPSLMVTVLLSFCSYISLNKEEKLILMISLFGVCVVGPFLVFIHQRNAIVISGPWDIATVEPN